MKARALVFTAPEEVTVRETAVSEPAPDEILVETRCSAISPGTELLVYRGNAPEKLAADESIEALAGDLSYPTQYGYAAVGDVIDTGTAADDEWIGTQVFAFHPHQSRFTVPTDAVVAVPDGIDGPTATLLPTLETATNLLLDGQPRFGERVAVFGAGAIGLSTIRLLAEFPINELTVVEPIDRRRELARSVGADLVVAPDEATELSDADLAYELSGRPSVIDTAIEAVGYDGRIVVGSWYGSKQSRLDLGRTFHRDRISIESSQVSTISPSLRGRWSKERRRQRALEWLKPIDTELLLTDRVPFTDSSSAYHLLDTTPETTLQVLLTYEKATLKQ